MMSCFPSLIPGKAASRATGSWHHPGEFSLGGTRAKQGLVQEDLDQKGMPCMALLSKLQYKCVLLKQRNLAPHLSSISTQLLHSLLSSLPAAHQRCSGSHWHPPAQPSCLGKFTEILVPGGAWTSQELGQSPWAGGTKLMGILGKVEGKALSWGEQSSSQPPTTNREIPPWQHCRGLRTELC